MTYLTGGATVLCYSSPLRRKISRELSCAKARKARDGSGGGTTRIPSPAVGARGRAAEPPELRTHVREPDYKISRRCYRCVCWLVPCLSWLCGVTEDDTIGGQRDESRKYNVGIFARLRALPAEPPQGATTCSRPPLLRATLSGPNRINHVRVIDVSSPRNDFPITFLSRAATHP